MSQPITAEEAARQVLDGLLERAERHAREGRQDATTWVLGGPRDGRPYHALASLADRERFHALIALAERAGAIHVERERFHDDPGMRRLVLADLPALARHQGRTPFSTRIARAEADLAPYRERFPIIEAVLAHWRANKRVRGQTCEAATGVADAARAILARDTDPGQERVLRKESHRLFGDSKRLEALTPWLEVLLTGELGATGLEREHVWAMIGLRREPQPLLLAGPAIVHLDDGSRIALPPHHPIGLPVDAITGLETRAAGLLSIENLASFHEAVARRGNHRMLLVFTGGMPSPAWRRAYARMFAALPEAATIWHWGDIDEGGFRIAAALAHTTRQAGRTLHAWRMSPLQLPESLRACADRPDARRLAAMQDFARRAMWPQVAEALAAHPLTLEQEGVPAVLPPLDPAP